MIEQKEDEFQEGDVVYCAAYGEGVVKRIEEDVLVHHKGGSMVWYTLDGRLAEDCPRCLFFSPPTPGSTVRPFVSKNIGKTVFFEYKDTTLWVKGIVYQEDKDSLTVAVGKVDHKVVKSTAEYYFVEKEKE